MISEGSFLARATGPLSWVKSPEKGTSGVHATFLLKDGPDAGQRVDWSSWITDNTAARIEESLRFCGYDGERDDSITGQDVIVVVKHEPNPKDGKTYARVAFVNDPNRARFEALEGAELAGAKARIRAAAIAAQKNAAPRASDPKF